MALMTKRGFSKSLLEIQNPENDLYKVNHIFEPEFHQDIYVQACEATQKIPGAFQVGAPELLDRAIGRGTQPDYADDEDDEKTLSYEGMIKPDGTRLSDRRKKQNICALKSNCIRNGYIDTSLARSVSRSFYERVTDKAAVLKNDILINSTGDGTIGRVAVYHYDSPAIVDGHITIVRYKDPALAWYVAAFLLTETGQNQIYRYINSSSGQVEIYPQDISRIWVKPASRETVTEVQRQFSSACKQHDRFYGKLTAIVHRI